MTLVGVVPAAIRAEQMMRQADALSELALDACLAGNGLAGNVMSAEAAKRRQEAMDLLAPYMPHNA